MSLLTLLVGLRLRTTQTGTDSEGILHDVPNNPNMTITSSVVSLSRFRTSLGHSLNSGWVPRYN